MPIRHLSIDEIVHRRAKAFKISLLEVSKEMGRPQEVRSRSHVN